MLGLVSINWGADQTHRAEGVEPAECHFRATFSAVPAVDALKRSAKPGVLLAAGGEDIGPAADCREVDRVVPLHEGELLQHTSERSRCCTVVQPEGLVVPQCAARRITVPAQTRARPLTSHPFSGFLRHPAMRRVAVCTHYNGMPEDDCPLAASAPADSTAVPIGSGLVYDSGIVHRGLPNRVR